MAFKDIFEEQRKKLQNYFGVGKPGLGTFGQQASNVLKPIVNKNIQNYQKAGRYLQPQNVVKRNVQNYQQVARPVQQFAQRQIQRPIIQANLRPIQTLKRGYQSQPRMEEMPAIQAMHGVNPYLQLQREDKLYNKITNWRPQNKVLNVASNFLLGSPEENQKKKEAFRAINIKSETPEQRKLAQSGSADQILWGIGGGTKSVNTIDQAAKTIAKSKSAVIIGDVLKKTLGIESNKVGKSLIKDLISESDPKKVKNIVNLLKPASQKAQTIIPKATDALSNEARKTETGIFGTATNKEKQASARADFEKMRDYQFKYKPGDKVKTSKGDEIVLEGYIQDGQPRYTTYPAGKKQSYAYHTWSYEKDLSSTGKSAIKLKTGVYTKERVKQLLDENPDNNQLNNLYYGLRDFNGDVSNILNPQEKRLIDKFSGKSSQPLSPQSKGITPKVAPPKGIEAYHGTASKFDNFDMSKAGLNNARTSKLGVWFTNDQKAAQEFADTAKAYAGKGGKSIVRKDTLNLKNPLVIEGKNGQDSFNIFRDELAKFTQFEKPGYNLHGRQIEMQGDKINYEGFKKYLSDQGYDGIIIKNTEFDAPKGKKIDQILVLDPKNITPKVEGTKLTTKSVAEPKVQLKPVVRTPESTLPQREVQKVSQKVGSDVSFDNIVQSTETSVKDKVNLLDMFRTPDRVLEKIGLGQEAKTLRTQYDKYLKELPQEIDRISKWAEQTTPEQNNRIFKYLDGQDVKLSSKESKIAGEVRSYLEDWAEKLKLPKDKRITNYITHIFDKDLVKKEFPEELARIIDDKVAGSVYDPFTSERLGKKGYIEDTWRALDAYVKRATRKYNIDTALEPIKKKAETLELSQFKYVKNYIDRINMRPTELDNMVDNFLKSTPIGYKLGQRPTTELTRNARQMVYRGTLGLNVGSTLKNLSQGANTYARLGEKYTTKGYLDLFKNYRSSELSDVGILADDLIQDKNIGVYKSALSKLDKGLFWMFETAEKINRGAAYYGAKAKALNEGKTLQEAIDFAKKTVRDTQFTFGSIDTPPVLQSDAAKTLLQFQSFNIKQGEFLGEMISKKDLAGLTRWIGASLAFVYGVGQAIGMQPKDIIPTIRVGGSPIFGAIKEGYNAITGAPDKYGNRPENLKDRVTPFAKSLIPLIPGGVQGKKLIEGLGAANRGYVPTSSGNVRNPITPSVSNKIRGALFGQNNLPESRQYFDTKQSPLGTGQSNIFKTVSDKADYYKSVIDKRSESKEIDKLKSGDGGTTSSGVIVKKIGNEWKTFDTEQEANFEIAKDTFKKSGKNIQEYEDKVFRLQSDGSVKVQTKDEYDYAVGTNKLQRLKANEDYKGWMETANKQLEILDKQLKDPTLDELEQSELIEKADKILSDMEKYQGYGGFKKGKKAKTSSLTGISNLTSGIKIPIRTAKKPTFKNISATPKIAIKSTKPKLISKATLAKI